MNKRPLLIMFVCFVLGEISIYTKMRWLIVIIATGVVFLCLDFVYANGVEPVLLLFVLCFILGVLSCYRMMTPRCLNEILQKKNIQATVEGQIASVEKSKTSYLIYIKHASYATDSAKGKFANKILLKTDKYNWKIGQKLRIYGALKQLEHARNPGEFDAFVYYRCRNVDYECSGQQVYLINAGYDWLQQTLWELRYRFCEQYEKMISDRDAGVLKAIVLGERSGLDASLKKQYQQTGIAHIIAISGLHVGMIGIFLFSACKRIGLSYITALVCSSSMLLVYGILTGMTGSCKRALIMLIVSFFGKTLGRAYDMLSAMALAGIIILIDSPLQFLDAGFLLSFGAVMGIAVVFPFFSKWKFCQRKNFGSKILKSFCLSMSIQVITLPIIAWFYFEIPMYSMFLNLVMIPMMSLLVPLAMAGLLVSFIWQTASAGIFLPVQILLYGMNVVSAWCNRLPFAHFVIGQPKIWQIILYYVVLLLIVWMANLQKRKIVVGVLIIFVLTQAILPLSTRNKLRITMLDVGQGDGFVISLPNQKVLLVDGGSTSKTKLFEYTYEPFLKSQGIVKADYVLVTHSDADHTQAIEELLNHEFPIGCLLLSDIINPDENYKQIVELAYKNDIPVIFVSQGQVLNFEDVKATFFYPPKGYSTESANEYSLSFILQYETFSMAFTGDLSEVGEKTALTYLRKHNIQNVDILKVGHHGSKSSTSEDFLMQLNPRYALISAGENNRYGHPHMETIMRLRKHCVKTFCTIQQGAVTIDYCHKRLFIKSYLVRY